MNLESTSKKAITLYLRFLIILFKKLKINYSLVHMPTTAKGIALLKSPHVNKKAKEHFEIKTYRSLVIITCFPEVKTLKYLLINKPKAVSLTLNFCANKIQISSKKIVKKGVLFISDSQIFYYNPNATQI